jgi:hypothetical protein
MNEHLDPLEAELMALKPQPLSPELKTRIAGELARGSESSGWVWAAKRTTGRWPVALATALGLAACLLAALFIRQHGVRNPAVDPPRELPHAPLAISFDSSLPTLWTYRRALSGPPNELDALLNMHAGSVSPAAERFVHVSAFPRASAELQSLLGEL